MRSTFPLVVALLAAAPTLLAAPEVASAQGPDVRDIRPIVFLLTDTSGSMERLPGCVCTTSGCAECLPNCSANQENRWSTVVQALTGEFTSFSCVQRNRSIYVGDPDHNYFIPHHEITSTNQLTNGILDVYDERIRFGFMSFDSVASLTTGNTLVPLTSWDTAFITQSEGSDGMFSYGDVETFTFPGCLAPYGIDNGFRNETPPGGAGAGYQPGNLISIGDGNDYAATNQRIQDSILDIRPFGPTPVAGMLDDLQFYLDNHPDVRPVTNPGDTGDLFAACRERFGILITDGYPNADFRDPLYGDSTGNCSTAGYTCPYPTPEESAASLCDMAAGGDCQGDLDGLFVVGFNVAGDPAIVTRLNDMADLGGTGDLVRSVTGGTDGALFADDIATLRDALAAVLDASAPGTTTRTNPVFAQTALTGSTAQFQFNTGFQQASSLGEPWQGVLERRRFTCNGTAVEEQPVEAQDRFHEIITAQGTSGRRIFTVVPTLATDTGARLLGDGLQYLTNNSLPVATGIGGTIGETGLDSVPFNSGNVSLAHLGVSTSSERDTVIDWVYGAGRANALGDIYHSSPAVVTAPRNDRPDQAFNLFRADPLVRDRPSVIYVGTNDGLLHAIAAEDYSNGSVTLTAGTELWSFVPPILLPKLESASQSHQEMLDGAPVVKDMFIARLPAAVPTADQYRSVLVVGLRGGGRGYFALDVTDPVAAMTSGPEFLWQFTDSDMGESYGLPALAQVVHNAGGVNERAVAILPGGRGVTAAGTCAAPTGVTSGLSGNRTQRNCWGTQGRSVYVVDLYTGRLIRKFDHNDGISSPITGGVAVFTGEVGTVASRAFMSDHDGMIWRLDVSAADPAAWDVTPFHDVFYDEAADFAEPAYNPPVLSTNNDGQVVVIQATGNIDVLDGTTANRVVSLTESIAFDANGAFNPATDIGAVLNWEERLQAGEQVTGPIELFASNVYFSTFVSQTSSTNACNFGFSRIFGIGYIDGTGAFETAPSTFERILNTFTNQIVLGVQVTRRPSCFVGVEEFDPYVASYYNVVQQGGGGFQLTAQVSGGGGTSASGGTVNELSIDLPAPAFYTRVEGRAGSID